MLKEYKEQTNIGVGFGLILEVIGYATQALSNGDAVLGGLAGLSFLVGIPLFIWGCSGYARGKGYAGSLGLLGILSWVGLLVPAMLPDQEKAPYHRH